MQLDKALSQISEIHAQVLKTEVFRGYRARTALLTAAIATMAAWVQSVLMPPESSLSFTLFWVAVAGFAALICAIDVYRASMARSSRSQRWKTVLVVAQTAPALLVGAVVTAILVQRPGSEPMLPGLWATIFALGVWSARPYMPKAIGLVALFYLLAGTWLMVSAWEPVPSPWGMGLTFGFGQAATAVVLYLNIERGLTVTPGREHE